MGLYTANTRWRLTDERACPYYRLDHPHNDQDETPNRIAFLWLDTDGRWKCLFRIETRAQTLIDADAFRAG